MPTSFSPAREATQPRLSHACVLLVLVAVSVPGSAAAQTRIRFGVDGSAGVGVMRYPEQSVSANVEGALTLRVGALFSQEIALTFQQGFMLGGPSWVAPGAEARLGAVVHRMGNGEEGPRPGLTTCVHITPMWTSIVGRRSRSSTPWGRVSTGSEKFCSEGPVLKA